MSSKAVGNVNIRVTSNTSQFQKGMARSGQAAAMFQRSLGSAKKAIIGFGAALVSRAVFRSGAKMVHLAMEQEAAENRLAAAFRSRGIQTAWATERMKRYASELQKVTIYGDEAILSQSALMVSMAGLSGETLERATKAAIGLSAAYGIELAGAFRLVSRAAVGDTASLKRYGIIVDQTKTKAEQFNEVLLAGAKGFSIASAEAKTASGQMKSLGNVWGDVMEKLGSRIMTDTTGAFSAIRKAVEWADNYLTTPSLEILQASEATGSPEQRLKAMLKEQSNIAAELQQTYSKFIAFENKTAMTRGPVGVSGSPGGVLKNLFTLLARNTMRPKYAYDIEVMTEKLRQQANAVSALELAMAQGSRQAYAYINAVDPQTTVLYHKAIKGAVDYALAIAKVAAAYGDKKMKAAENWFWRLQKHKGAALAEGAKRAVSAWGELKRDISEAVKELIRYNAEDAKQKALAKATAKRRLAERRSFAESVRTSTRTPLEEYKERMAELKKSRLAGDIDFDTYRRAALQAKLDLASGAQQAGGTATSSSLVGQAQKVQDAALNKQADLSRRQLGELEAIRQILGGTLTVDGGFVAMGV